MKWWKNDMFYKEYVWRAPALRTCRHVSNGTPTMAMIMGRGLKIRWDVYANDKFIFSSRKVTT